MCQHPPATRPRLPAPGSSCVALTLFIGNGGQVPSPGTAGSFNASMRGNGGQVSGNGGQVDPRGETLYFQHVTSKRFLPGPDRVFLSVALSSFCRARAGASLEMTSCWDFLRSRQERALTCLVRRDIFLEAVLRWMEPS